MANKRMISKEISSSARFLQMPQTAQNLYFHLSVNTDDDGIVEAFTIMRMINANDDDLKILDAKGFVKILNADLVIYVYRFQEINRLRADQKHDSPHKLLLIQVLGHDIEDILVESKVEDDVKRRIEQRKLKRLEVSAADNQRTNRGSAESPPPSIVEYSIDLDKDITSKVNIDINNNIICPTSDEVEPVINNNLEKTQENGKQEKPKNEKKPKDKKPESTKFAYTLTQLKEDITEIIGKKFNNRKAVQGATVKRSAVEISCAKQLKSRLDEGRTRQDFRDMLFNLKRDSYHRDQEYKFVTLEFVTRAKKFEFWLENGKGEYKKPVVSATSTQPKPIVVQKTAEEIAEERRQSRLEWQAACRERIIEGKKKGKVMAMDVAKALQFDTDLSDLLTNEEIMKHIENCPSSMYKTIAAKKFNMVSVAN